MRARAAPEMHAGRYHLSVVEHHQSTFRKVFREIPEDGFTGRTVLIYKQFGGIPLRKRIFCNPFVRQGIVIVLDVNVWYHYKYKDNQLFAHFEGVQKQSTNTVSTVNIIKFTRHNLPIYKCFTQSFYRNKTQYIRNNYGQMIDCYLIDYQRFSILSLEQYIKYFALRRHL